MDTWRSISLWRRPIVIGPPPCERATLSAPGRSMIEDLPVLCRAAGEKHGGPRHLQRIWRGEQLAGKRVLVRCYHGLGDTIQFVRFMPALRAIASEVTLWCQPALLELLQHASESIVFCLYTTACLRRTSMSISKSCEVPHAIRATYDLVEVGRPYQHCLGRGNPCPNSVLEFTLGLVWGC